MVGYALKIGQTNGRKPFGIYAGVSKLASFKTLEEAEKALEKNGDVYEYWAKSVSVSVDNSTKKIIWI